MPTHDPLTQPEPPAPEPTSSGATTLWTNPERTVLLSIFDDEVTIALRDTPDHIWSPPIALQPLATAR